MAMRNSFEGPSGYTGGVFEDELLGGIMCGWDNKRYIEARKSKDWDTANKLVSDWIKKNLSEESLTQWGRSNGEGRKRLLMDWARKNQPEDWKPEEPLFVKIDNDKVTKKNVWGINLHTMVS